MSVRSIVFLVAACLALPALAASPPLKKPRLLKPVSAAKTLRAGQAAPSQKKISPVKATNGPAPNIVCDQPVYDFGTVAQGQEVKHVFKIRNTGKGVLKITRARGG